MTKEKLTVTTPYGILTRSTHRTYTHVVALTTPYLRGLAWCGSLRLAEGQLRYWANNARNRFHLNDAGFEIQIFPIDSLKPTATDRVYTCDDCGVSMSANQRLCDACYRLESNELGE